MSETADKRLTPDAQEKLAHALLDKLARERIRRRPWVIAGLILLVGAVVGIWYACRAPEPLPPLMLVAYDALESDNFLKAQLVAPGNPHAKLEGLEIHLKMDATTAKTDAAGVARFSLGDMRLRNRVYPLRIEVFFLERTGEYRRDKAISLTADSMFGDPAVIVSLDDFTTDGMAIDWLGTELVKLPRPPSRIVLGMEGRKVAASGAKCEVIYASGDVDWATYQRVREWLHMHKGDTDADAPTGPLVHERADAIEERLKGRMGAEKVRRWRPNAAAKS